MAPSDISKMTVPVLRKELEKLGLDTSGLKAVLVERLTKARAEAAIARDAAIASEAIAQALKQKVMEAIKAIEQMEGD